MTSCYSSYYLERTYSVAMASQGGGRVQPLQEIEAAVIGDFLPVEAIEVSGEEEAERRAKCERSGGNKAV